MKNKQGIALITSILLMVVLTGVISLLFATTLSELKQSRAGVTYVQARALAEAGLTYGHNIVMNKTNEGLNIITDQEFDSYSTSFEISGRNPAEADSSDANSYVVTRTDWNTVAANLTNQLNTQFSTLSNSELNSIGTISLTYNISNFKLKTASLVGQTFMANYSVTSLGKSNNDKGQRRVEEKGIVTILIGRKPLSHYLFLVDNANGNNIPFANGTIFNGPVHANIAWGFRGADSVFMDEASTADNVIFFHCSDGTITAVANTQSGTCASVNTPNQQFQFNQPVIDPADALLSQQRAALGIDSENTAVLSAADMCTALAPDCNPVSPNGIYIPTKDTNGDSVGDEIKGGIAIIGDVDELTLDGTVAGQQTYIIRQGNIEKTIVLDYSTNETCVKEDDLTDPNDDNDPPVCFNGTTNGIGPNSGGPNGQIYVHGSIKNLHAPPRTGTIADADFTDHPPPKEIQAALEENTQLNITARDKIEVTSDLIYAKDPTLHPNIEAVLGLISMTDNIEMDANAPDDIYLWGALLTMAPNTGITTENWSTRPAGTRRYFGSVVIDQAQVAGTTSPTGYTSSYDYDTRLKNGKISPPNFPVTRDFTSHSPNAVRLTFKEF